MLICVCEKCQKVVTDRDDGASIECNFKEKSILFTCPNCRHNNEISWKQTAKPYAKTKVMR